MTAFDAINRLVWMSALLCCSFVFGFGLAGQDLSAQNKSQSDKKGDSAAGQQRNALELPEKISWQKYRPGITIAKFKLTRPRALRFVVAKIDLTAKLKFVVTPGNGEQKLETTGLKTSSFLKKFGCDLAINAAPFGPVTMLEQQQHDVSGLQIADGATVSPVGPKRPVLGFGKNNRVYFYAKPPQKLDHLQNAVSGFQLVLTKGKILGQDKTLHPRTAVGATKDGKQLYLLVIDGRQKGASEGATTNEVGRVLKLLGCYNGINLDGGGTSTIVAKDQDGKPKVLNVPIHLGIRGTERPSASHLGVISLKK